MIQHLALIGLLVLIPTIPALRASDGCGKPLPGGVVPGHSKKHTIQVADPVLGNVMRTYRVHVPAPYNLNNEVPVPLVLDYHGLSGSADWQEKDSNFVAVADNFDEEGFLVILPNGMGDNEWKQQSFNCSRTDGPLGLPCDPDREKYGVTPCYDSCPNCDPYNSCDWSSCHDDVAFTRTLLDAISSEYCVNLDSVHMSGISNGGMFTYYAISQLSGRIASIAPVASAPLLGFGALPDSPVSLIDVHGLADDTIPYSWDQAEGVGPQETLISWDGYYYYPKPNLMGIWAEGQGCSVSSSPWPTWMDGQDGWECNIWSGCRGGAEVVSCTANHNHDYPFGEGLYIEGTKIIWQFMKSHPLK